MDIFGTPLYCMSWQQPYRLSTLHSKLAVEENSINGEVASNCIAECMSGLLGPNVSHACDEKSCSLVLAKEVCKKEMKMCKKCASFISHISFCFFTNNLFDGLKERKKWRSEVLRQLKRLQSTGKKEALTIK